MNQLNNSSVFSPTAVRPYWGLRFAGTAALHHACRVKSVMVNGRRVRQFYIEQSGRISPWHKLEAGVAWELTARYPWRNGERLEVRVEGEGQTWSAILSAPATGAYSLPDWPYFASIVLAEQAGLDRTREPVHLSMTFFADQVRPDCADLRIMSFDEKTSELRPALFQVLESAYWNDPELVQAEPYRYQPTRTVDLVVLADVPAHARRVYLVLHGNPAASAPEQRSDLAVRHGADGVTVENDFYRFKLHGPSGMIDEVEIKQGRNVTLDHHIEREGTVHWNPDIWSPPRPWVHTNDWPNSAKSYDHGPACFVAKSHGVMPDGVDEVEMSVTYCFYAHTPLVMMSSAMHIKQDVPAKSLRNGEIVFNRKIIDHVAYRDPRGQLHDAAVTDLWPHPMPHEGWHIAPDSPWICLYSPKHEIAFGHINAGRMEYRWDKGVPRVEDSYYYVAVGPWTYIARALVYPWGSSNPSRTAIVPANSYYMERIGWLPLALAGGKLPASSLDEWSERLRRPLHIHVHTDIDARTSALFVNPIIRYPIEQTDSEYVLNEPRTPIMRPKPLS